MSDIKVFYGSTSGNTETSAKKIAGKLEADCINIADAKPEDFSGSLLIFGTSTWGIGELQDDWENGIDKLKPEILSGKKVALFGLGDQSGFGDTFIDGVGTIYHKAVECGADVIGKWSIEGYEYSGSTADLGGQFAGLALDDDNEPGKTDERIAKWVDQLKIEADL
tara:strand:+ start:74 stop:571 length:498 start_codon:yes stop_codon:yes gene_type:complete